jgi:hypothetical protein
LDGLGRLDGLALEKDEYMTKGKKKTLAKDEVFE